LDRRCAGRATAMASSVPRSPTAAAPLVASWLALTVGQAWALARGPLPQRVTGLKRWDVIGPFPYSSREQGADVLEAFGGILAIPRGGNQTYPSELVAAWAGREAGKAGWSVAEAEEDGGRVEVDYGQMRWEFMMESMGESVAGNRGWAISDFNVSVDGTYAVGCHGVGSFLLDGRELLVGDAYRRGWAASQPVQLEKGWHTLHLPFVAWGSRKSFRCRVEPYETDPEAKPLQVLRRGGAGGRPDLFGDVVDGRLNSELGSVVVENRGATPLRLVAAWAASDDLHVELSPQSPSRLAPSQKLPLRFHLAQVKDHLLCQGRGWGRKYPLQITVSATDTESRNVSTSVQVDLVCRSLSQPYKFTFADADASVQYAAVRAPRSACPAAGCPVLFATHGAGVESDPRRNPAWAGAYERQEAAWVLLPTNRDAYGYDWQMAGMQDGLRALEHLVRALPGVPRNLTGAMGADSDRLLYSGHSMGGHGCLEFLTHHGDRALAAAPAAGWISFPLYAFDNLRTGDNMVDPTLRGILYSSAAEWSTDLYVANAVGVPFLARVGGNDTSVPPWHLRRFARLLDQETGQPGTAELSEVPGRGHWFNGVVGDKEMQRFYDRHLYGPLPPLPRRFASVTLNPASSSGRGGLRIEQLEVPYRLARIEVERGEDAAGPWQLRTENVRRFVFSPPRGRELPVQGFVVDGVEFLGRPPAVAPAHYCAVGPDSPSGAPAWRLCEGPEATSWTLSERSPSTYGPMRQVFETAPLLLVYGTGGGSEYRKLLEGRARFVANSAYYRGRFAIEVLPDTDASLPALLSADGGRNVIILGGPDVNGLAAELCGDWPLRMLAADGGPTALQVGPRHYTAPDLGALFLAPLWAPVGAHAGTAGAGGTAASAEEQSLVGGPPRLALVVAGSSMEGFTLASKLLPLSAGLTLPDYVVVEPSFAWRGAGGILAAGFYDNHWQISERTGYLRPFAGRWPVAPAPILP